MSPLSPLRLESAGVASTVCPSPHWIHRAGRSVSEPISTPVPRPVPDWNWLQSRAGTRTRTGSRHWGVRTQTGTKASTRLEPRQCWAGAETGTVLGPEHAPPAPCAPVRGWSSPRSVLHGVASSICTDRSGFPVLCCPACLFFF